MVAGQQDSTASLDTNAGRVGLHPSFESCYRYPSFTAIGVYSILLGRSRMVGLCT